MEAAALLFPFADFVFGSQKVRQRCSRSFAERFLAAQACSEVALFFRPEFIR